MGLILGLGLLLGQQHRLEPRSLNRAGSVGF